MHTIRPGALALALLALTVSPMTMAEAAGPGDAKIIAEATGGRFTSPKGQFFDKDCNQKTDYQADVVDLNGDGRPEVFLQIFGTCQGGATGVFLELYIQGADGRWQQQFGFPGVYQVLKTRNKGFPDIEIGGPGSCAPVWRWNGKQYALFRKCPM